MTDQLVAAIRSRPEPPARTEPRAGGTGRDGLTAMQQEAADAAAAWRAEHMPFSTDGAGIGAR